MPISANTLEMLLNAGLSGQALIDVVASIDADTALVVPTKIRTAGAVRTERYRQRQASQSVTSDVTCDATSDITLPPSPLDKENPPAPPKEINPPLPPNTPAARTGSAVLSELMTVLDELTARAVIEHRKAIRKPLTPHAAMLMARKLGATPDPTLAADTMIGNGWQGFEPEWVQKRAIAGARSPPHKTDFQLRQDAAIAACDQFIFGEDHDQHTTRDSAQLDLGRGDYKAF